MSSLWLGAHNVAVLSALEVSKKMFSRLLLIKNGISHEPQSMRKLNAFLVWFLLRDREVYRNVGDKYLCMRFRAHHQRNNHKKSEWKHQMIASLKVAYTNASRTWITADRSRSCSASPSYTLIYYSPRYLSKTLKQFTGSFSWLIEEPFLKVSLRQETSNFHTGNRKCSTHQAPVQFLKP